jgi:hypothetical protein
MIQKLPSFLLLFTMLLTSYGIAQTVIPNPGFENWTTTGNFTNPTGWDTPNEELMAIPFFGFPVVTKSSDHQGSGSFSAKLETKHLTLPPLDVPGFMTCGNLVVDITTASYVLSGGVPAVDQPTHLKGYYKYLPKGGDSCVVGIGLTKWTGTTRDSIAYGVFSTKDTVNDWTPFSAWIDYDTVITPDTMNIIAMSTAQEIMTPGTILYVDNLYLDYTVGTPETTTSAPIDTYLDRETKRLLIFIDGKCSETTRISLYDMSGRVRYQQRSISSPETRYIIPYQDFSTGIYLLEIIQGTNRFTKKYFLN